MNQETKTPGVVEMAGFDNFVEKFLQENIEYELFAIVGPMIGAPASKLAGAQPAVLVIPVFKLKK